MRMRHVHANNDLSDNEEADQSSNLEPMQTADELVEEQDDVWAQYNREHGREHENNRGLV
jgi:hypothetical protein